VLAQKQRNDTLEFLNYLDAVKRNKASFLRKTRHVEEDSIFAPELTSVSTLDVFDFSYQAPL